MIKEKPEDFIVKEVMDLHLGEGRYAYFILKKKNWNTLNAIRKIAERLRIDFKRLGYAGRKDKVAVTEQYVSAFNISRAMIERLRIKDIWIKFVGYGGTPIKLGSLKGNNFEIVINRARELKKVDFVANYFDEQRFSMGNIDMGRMLVKKEFNEMCERLELTIERNDVIGALRTMGVRRLQFYLHAFDSYLWNEVLALYLSKFKHFRVKYTYGEFVFLNEKVKNFEMPLINSKTIFKDKEIEEIYAKVLKANGVKQSDFLMKEIPEIVTRGASRNIFAQVKWKSIDTHKVKFYLPKGSYATIVLKKAASI